MPGKIGEREFAVSQFSRKEVGGLIDTFQRIEKKYLLNQDQYEAFLERIQPYMQLDEYGLHTICNIYYDTKNFDLIRRSLDKPVYKEKMRLRSYGIPGEKDVVFLEIKKKYDGVVYKRRVPMKMDECQDYLDSGEIPQKYDSQIMREIDYFIKFYKPRPAMYIAYDRMAYFGKEDPNLRLTFDQNIRNREEDLDLKKGDKGNYLMDKGYHLLEIKIPMAIPLWLSSILTDLEIYPVSFSKYGRFYEQREQ